MTGMIDQIVQPHADRLNGRADQLVGGLQLVADLLSDIRGELREQRTESTFGYVVEQVTSESSAGGAGRVDLQPPPGIGWNVKLVALVSGTGGGFALYLNEIAPGNVVYVADNAPFQADGPPADIYVPAGQKLVGHFFNQPADTDCWVRLKVEIVGDSKEDMP